MFDRFKYYFEGTETSEKAFSAQSKSTTETDTGTEKKGFTTQAEILKALGLYNKEHAICSPLANEYLMYRRGLINQEFMKGDAKTIYERAERLKKHQQDLQNQGKDGLHIGFEGTEYNKVTMNASDVTSVENLASHLNANHALLTYPVTYPDGKKDTHQVYIGKEPSHEQCVSFNANKEGGETFAPCGVLYEKFFKKIMKDDGEGHVIIATSNAPVKPKL